MHLLMLDLHLRLDVGASNGLRLRLELLGRLQFVMMMMMMMIVRVHRDLEDEKKEDEKEEDKEVDAEKSPKNLDPDRKVREVFGRGDPSSNSLDGRLRLDGE